MTKRLGWVVEADTRRDGCDASERHQRWTRRDAEDLAAEIRAAHAGDSLHWVRVRRETAEDDRMDASTVGHYDS